MAPRGRPSERRYRPWRTVCECVGIDLHRRRSHVTVLDEAGPELRSRRIVNDPQTFLRLLAEIDASRGSR
jgi:hypothetical protein